MLQHCSLIGSIRGPTTAPKRHSKGRNKKTTWCLVPAKLDKMPFGVQSIPKLGSACTPDMGTEMKDLEEGLGLYRHLVYLSCSVQNPRGCVYSKHPNVSARGTPSSHPGALSENATLGSKLRPVFSECLGGRGLGTCISASSQVTRMHTGGKELNPSPPCRPQSRCVRAPCLPEKVLSCQRFLS